MLGLYINQKYEGKLYVFGQGFFPDGWTAPAGFHGLLTCLFYLIVGSFVRNRIIFFFFSEHSIDTIYGAGLVSVLRHPEK